MFMSVILWPIIYNIVYNLFHAPVMLNVTGTYTVTSYYVNMFTVDYLCNLKLSITQFILIELFNELKVT